MKYQYFSTRKITELNYPLDNNEMYNIQKEIPIERLDSISTHITTKITNDVKMS